MVVLAQNLKYFLIFLIIKLSYQSLGQIYSPFYLNKFDFNDSVNPLKIKLPSNCNLVFIATGCSGITISDRLLSGELLSQKIGNNYINTFDVSSDCKYVFVGIPQQIQIFELANIGDKKLKLIAISSQNFKSQVQSLLTMLVKKNPTIIGTYSTGSTIIPQISSSIDELWLYISYEKLGSVDTEKTNQTYGKGKVKGIISIATIKNSFIFRADTWNGLFLSNIQNLSSQATNYPVKLSFKKFNFNQKASESIQSLALSQDNQLLFLGMRSEGMYVFDIRDLNNAQLFQQIQVDSHSMSIEFSLDGNYQYFQNALSVFLFERTQVNLNDNFPNLFNIHLIKNEPKPNIDYKWSFLIDSTNTYMIGAFEHDGMYVFPYYGDPYKLKVSNAIYSKLITIFQISDPSNPSISLKIIQEIIRHRCLRGGNASF
ncbi:hypothetical protein ABPG72_004474 [Tetrahymena utriculariae]